VRSLKKPDFTFMIDSFYSTGNQRLAVALATIGIPPRQTPLTVENKLGPDRKTVETRTTFYFEPVGVWTGFGGTPSIPIKAEDIARAYYDLECVKHASVLDPRIIAELSVIHACLEVRDVANQVRKAANPETRYIGVAICENTALLSQFAATAKQLNRMKVRSGTLYAEAEKFDDAIKTFKSFI
jgi:hypothetical protein